MDSPTVFAFLVLALLAVLGPTNTLLTGWGAAFVRRRARYVVVAPRICALALAVFALVVVSRLLR
jgi:hypothetical protein